MLEGGIGGDLDDEIRLHAHHGDVLVSPVTDVAATDDLGPRMIA